MATTIKFRNGKKLWRKVAGATKVARAAARAICCCVNDGGGGPVRILPTCNDQSSCADFCYTDRSDLDSGLVSEACDCPCPGRLGFPPKYRKRWNGIQLSTSPVYDPVGDEWKQIVGTSNFSFNDCENAEDSVKHTTMRHFNNDAGGSVPGSVKFDADQAVSVSYGETFPDKCATGEHCKDFYPVFRAFLSGSPAPFGFYIGIFNETPEGDWGPPFDTPGFTDLPLTPVPRCRGGTFTPIQNGNNPYVASAGHVILEPTCTNCDGSRVPPSNGTDPLRLCADEYDFSATVNDGVGGAPRLHLWRLFKVGPASWFGFDQYGSEAHIGGIASLPSDPAFKCCQKFANFSCDLACGTNDACWMATIDIGDIHCLMCGTGSCPPTSWTTLPGSDFTATGGFIEGC